MNILKFSNHFSKFPLFSLNDMQKHDEGFDRRRLIEWQEKGYIKRLANAWYYFTDKDIDENFLFLASNKIYQPSYISLESALSKYGFIPEGVFTTTAVSTLKTATFKSEIGHFSYRKIKNKLFWGYTFIPIEKTFYKIALPEKALIDYFYLNRQINTIESIQSQRFDMDAIKHSISINRLKTFCKQIEHRRLNMQIDLLIKILSNA